MTAQVSSALAYLLPRGLAQITLQLIEPVSSNLSASVFKRGQSLPHRGRTQAAICRLQEAFVALVPGNMLKRQLYCSQS